MRLLLVEDEPRAARRLAKGLREQAYAVDIAGDGAPPRSTRVDHDYEAARPDRSCRC